MHFLNKFNHFKHISKDVDRFPQIAPRRELFNEMWSSRGIKTNQFEFIVGPTTPEAIDDHGQFIWFYKLKDVVVTI